MEKINIGNSILQSSTEVFHKVGVQPSIFLMSGLHGDECEGILLNHMLFGKLRTENSPLLSRMAFLSMANADGVRLHQRWNANHVDLNRNWPTKDWSPIITNPRYPPGPSAGSEPETQNLKKYIESQKFEIVVDLHSYKNSVLLPLLAKQDVTLETSLNMLGKELAIPVVWEQEDLGYSIGGGFHAWCKEMGIHNLTIEVEKGIGQFAIKERYLEPVIRFLSRL